MRERPEPHIAMAHQRGAAALLVVMTLFFIVSLVAAYTSRNLIFEQKTSANQYRATQVFEAADAGLEWAVAQLNGGRIENSCQPSTTVTNRTYRERYLTIDQATGAITLRTATGGGSVEPRCVFDGSSGVPAEWRWSCSCPLHDAAVAALSAPGGNTPAPAFVVRLRPVTARPDLLWLDSYSCSRLDLSPTGCLRFAADRAGPGDGVAAVSAMVALRGALTRPPTAPLTLGGNLENVPVGSTLALSNADQATNGVTIHAGGTVPSQPQLTLQSLPGTPPSSSRVQGDASLNPAPVGSLTREHRLFVAFFGMLPATYFQQPGLPIVNCPVSCAAADVQLVARRNPYKPIRVVGGGTLNVNADLGIDPGDPAVRPVVLIVEGDLELAAGVTLRGLVYSYERPTWTWTSNGNASVLGAVIADGNLQLAGTGTTAVTYDPAVLTELRLNHGSFVRVPGSWRDFGL